MGEETEDDKREESKVLSGTGRVKTPQCVHIRKRSVNGSIRLTL